MEGKIDPRDFEINESKDIDATQYCKEWYGIDFTVLSQDNQAVISDFLNLGASHAMMNLFSKIKEEQSGVEEL